jgi:hypothetical protein
MRDLVSLSLNEAGGLLPVDRSDTLGGFRASVYPESLAGMARVAAWLTDKRAGRNTGISP